MNAPYKYADGGTGSSFTPDYNREGKCKRCATKIIGPPNKKYCDDCRKIVSKQRKKK